MPKDAEPRILDAFETAGRSGGAPWGTLFGKTSCGVAFAHGDADYNGHYGVSELCDICPPEQIALCHAAVGQTGPGRCHPRSASPWRHWGS
ncbi:hypothetical protein [Streptomyces sp. NPDC002187]|uniref:hypothetical protein n=1 Tax=Streptomyces sp. NPDC002187 TaxID=3364637 RepID=UPI0036B3B71E